MKILSYKFIYEWRYSSIVTGTFVLIVLGSLNYFSGAWDAENAPWYFPSAQAFIGMTLLVTLMPAYMGATGIYSYRRSFEIAQFTDSIHGTDLTQLFTATPWKLRGSRYERDFEVMYYRLRVKDLSGANGFLPSTLFIVLVL